jgi:lipopolysaccharide heptosyltransferase I
MEKNKLTVSIVNWNSAHILGSCLEVLCQYIPKNIKHEIIFVDNASSDNSVSFVKEKYPEIKIIQNEENLGFGTAHNEAIKIAQGEYILFLNTDVVLMEGTIEKLIGFMDKNRNIAICNPALFGLDGRQQETGITFPSVGSELFGRFENKKKKEPYKTDAVRGACMLARTDIIKKQGGFNEKYFLFLEETDLCFRLNKNGYEVWVLPDAQVQHKGGGSAETIRAEARIEYWRSRYKYFRENASFLSWLVLNVALPIKLFLDFAGNFFAAVCTLALNQKFKNKFKTYSKLVVWHILGRPCSWGISSQNIIKVNGWEIRKEFKDWWTANKDFVLSEKGNTTLVKENSSRKLFIYNEEFYVKAYNTRIFFKKPWKNEWMLINKIRQFAIPTIMPVVMGKGFLITKKLDGVQSLHDFFLENKNKLEAVEKNNLIKSLAEFINKVHKRGVFHRDFHAGNILIQKENAEYRFYIIDLHRAKILERLSKKEIINNLIELHKFFSLYLSSSDRLRFFKSYIDGTLLEGEYKKYAKLIAQKTKDACFRLWKKRDRLYIKKNKYSIKGKYDGIKYVLNPLYKDINIEFLIGCIRDRKGQVIKDSRSSFVSKIELEGAGKIILKIYRQKKFINYLKDIFRKSRGFKAWCGSWALITRGIDTPTPIMAGETRIYGIVKESYVITKEIPESKNLTLFIKSKDKAEINNFAEIISSFVRTIHDRGIFPLDMKGSNILIEEKDDMAKTYLIDLDHIKLLKKVTLNKRLYNLLQIKKSTGLVCAKSLPVKRIFVVKPSSFGDIVQSLPVAGMLKEQYKGASVWWLANSNYLDLFRLIPAVDKTIAFERQKWGKIRSIFQTIPEIFSFLMNIRRKRFDIVLDLQGLFRSGIIAWLTGAPIRIGFGDTRDFAYIFYNNKVYPTKDMLHAQERYFYLTGQITSAAKPRGILNIPVSEKRWAESVWGNKLKIAVNPGGRWDTKRWPVEKYSYVLNEILKKHNARIVILGDKNDKSVTKEILTRSPSDITDLVGKTNFIELTAILNKADLLITNDSGTMHLADYLNVPMIALFGPTDPRKTGPKGKDVIIIKSDMKCSPCFKRICDMNKCMQAIDEKTVVSAVEDILKKRISVI